MNRPPHYSPASQPMWCFARIACGFIAAVGLIVAASHRATAAEPPIQFGRDILPILSDNCFHCHGQDEQTREADLRLDTRDGALRTEQPVIVAGKSDHSELIRRITSNDPDLVMPPPSAPRRLTPDQIAKLRRWIDSGAAWGGHWAFEPIRRPPLPVVRDVAWVRQPIDRFVLHALESRGWRPSPELPLAPLARRASLDLTGLPPTREAIASLQENATSNLSAGADDQAYEAWIERLLASPHHAERLAWFWLDASRYSDTDGFQADATRTNWPWRDWVIEAFAQGMPFDQFTIEQFAGDLLPQATAQQKLATCFHRNHMTNGEGGRDPEESRIDYVIDRVNTVGALWLGLTLGCCQCHSHKYDPISQADYYRLSAFFNSIDETGAAGRNAKPYLAYESPRAAGAIAAARRLVAQREPQFAAAKLAAEPRFQAWLAQQLSLTRDGFVGWRPFVGTTRESASGAQLELDADQACRVSGPDPFHEDYRLAGPVVPSVDGRWRRITGLKLEVFPDPAHPKQAFGRGESGDFILTDVKFQIRRRGQVQVREVVPAAALASYSADPGKNGGYGDVKHVLDDDPRNGWALFGAEPAPSFAALFPLSEPLELADDEELLIEMQHRSTRGHANLGRFRWSLTDQPGPALERFDAPPLEQLAAAKPADIPAIDAKLRDALREQFLVDDGDYQSAKRALQIAKSQLSEAQSAAKVDVMVLSERVEPRPTHVLVRGAWDKKGEVVERDVPSAIVPWNNDDRSRLGLARWLVARDNPLTARVLANHLWTIVFGAGLVRTPEDFGLQGERPTHPELLDWLAAELIDSGWDLRHVLRLLVASSAYRQSSDAAGYTVSSSGATAAEASDPRIDDPENRLLWRGGRMRLPSWMIRDSALRAAGLLNSSVGGPPVRPYQPVSVWEEMFMGRFKYEPTEGAEQYRRSIYAFWRRSSSPAFLFDSAQRRVCEVRSLRTNTPLHALTLLNDLTYVEASRALAARTMQELPAAPLAEQLERLWEHVLTRRPAAAELAVLEREFAHARTHYEKHPEDAGRWLSHGQSASELSRASAADRATLAALTVVASLVLNLDEAITRQ
ncbi:MAG: PSD1 and planctomycete cytochrome C domain-containing protein [Pirellulales bacterium]